MGGLHAAQPAHWVLTLCSRSGIGAAWDILRWHACWRPPQSPNSGWHTSEHATNADASAAPTTVRAAPGALAAAPPDSAAAAVALFEPRAAALLLEEEVREAVIGTAGAAFGAGPGRTRPSRRSGRSRCGGRVGDR